MRTVPVVVLVVLLLGIVTASHTMGLIRYRKNGNAKTDLFGLELSRQRDCERRLDLLHGYSNPNCPHGSYRDSCDIVVCYAGKYEESRQSSIHQLTSWISLGERESCMGRRCHNDNVTHPNHLACCAPMHQLSKSIKSCYPPHYCTLRL